MYHVEYSIYNPPPPLSLCLSFVHLKKTSHANNYPIKTSLFSVLKCDDFTAQLFQLYKKVKDINVQVRI